MRKKLLFIGLLFTLLGCSLSEFELKKDQRDQSTTTSQEALRLLTLIDVQTTSNDTRETVSIDFELFISALRISRELVRTCFSERCSIADSRFNYCFNSCIDNIYPHYAQVDALIENL